MMVDMPPCSMFTQYEPSDLSAEEVAHLFELIVNLPEVHVWRGPDNSYSPQAWRDMCIQPHPRMHLVASSGVFEIPWCPGIWIVSVGTESRTSDMNVNLADVLSLNRVPCKVLRSFTQKFDDGWELVSNVQPFALRGDTVVTLQKFHSITDHAGDTHIQVLTKACTLRTLLQWQVDAKKSVLKEENDGQLAASAGQSASERVDE